MLPYQDLRLLLRRLFQRLVGNFGYERRGIQRKGRLNQNGYPKASKSVGRINVEVLNGCRIDGGNKIKDTNRIG